MSSSSANKIAVIGLGNTLRKDDGIGIIVLEALLKSLKHPQIDYLNFGIASFDLIHRLERYAIVLLIDGIDAGSPVNKIFRLENKLRQRHRRLHPRDKAELCKDLS